MPPWCAWRAAPSDVEDFARLIVTAVVLALLLLFIRKGPRP